MDLKLTNEQANSIRRILANEVRACKKNERNAQELLELRPDCRVEPDFWRFAADEAKALYDYVGEAMGCKKSS